MSSRIRVESAQAAPSLRAAALLACLALIGTGCAPAESPEEQPPVDPAIDARAVIEAHGKLVAAYEKGDVDAFLLMLEKSDDVTFFHPRMQDRWVGIDEVRKKLPLMFERLGGASWLDVHLDVTVEADVAWLTSHVLVDSPDLKPPFTGRGTEIWVRRGGEWRLSHGHWSENPEF